MLKKTLTAACVTLLAISLSGCGGGDTTVKNVSQTTVGQQLIDLQKARDSGAITQKEFDAQKKKILNANH